MPQLNKDQLLKLTKDDLQQFLTKMNVTISNNDATKEFLADQILEAEKNSNDEEKRLYDTIKGLIKMAKENIDLTKTFKQILDRINNLMKLLKTKTDFENKDISLKSEDERISFLDMLNLEIEIERLNNNQQKPETNLFDIASTSKRKFGADLFDNASTFKPKIKTELVNNASTSKTKFETDLFDSTSTSKTKSGIDPFHIASKSKQKSETNLFDSIFTSKNSNTIKPAVTSNQQSTQIYGTENKLYEQNPIDKEWTKSVLRGEALFNGELHMYKGFRELIQRILKHPQFDEQNRVMLLARVCRGHAQEIVSSAHDIEDAFRILDDNYASTLNIENRIMSNVYNLPTVDTMEKFAQSEEFIGKVRSIVEVVEQQFGTTSAFDTRCIDPITTKIPDELRKEFILRVEKQTPRNLLGFLEKARTTASNFVRNQLYVSQNRNSKQTKFIGPKPASSFITTTSTVQYCGFHGETGHSSSSCQYTLEQKLNAIRTRKLCYNCLSNKHFSKDCDRKWLTCSRCKKHHYTYLHDIIENLNSTTTTTAAAISNQQTNDTEESNTMNINANSLKTSLLQTATFKFTRKNHTTQIRILLDQGSSYSYVDESIVNKLQLPVYQLGYSISVSGIEQTKSLKTNTYVKINMNDVFNNKEITLTLLVLKKLMIEYVNSPVNVGPFNEKYHPIADFSVGPIQMIIGQDHINTVWLHESTPIDDNFRASKTVFGNVIHGSTQTTATTLNNIIATKIHLMTNEIIEEDGCIDLEVIKQQSKMDFIDHYANNNIKFDTLINRYILKLPWFQNFPEELTNNFKYVMKRSATLFSQLIKNGNYETSEDALNQMIEKGYIEKASPEKVNYWLPLGIVIKTDRTTTKIRIVQDGSGASNNQLSINSCLFKGVVSADYNIHLIRFRTKSKVLTADIKEAFMQIKIEENDRSYLGVMWKTSNEFKYYRMTSLPFGLTCSPFMLEVVLQCHFKNHPITTSAKIKMNQCFYVDDFIFTSDDDNELSEVKQKLTESLKRCNMLIHKWKMSYESEEKTKILGVTWDVANDRIGLQQPNFSEFKPTKRFVASILASIFDPLGLISPVKVLIKSKFREICNKKLDWDATLPLPLTNKILNIVNDLNENLSLVNIKRAISYPDIIHLFCDASGISYGTVVYVRNQDEFLMLLSKSFLKGPKTTIPQAEFSALLLSLQLTETLRPIFPDLPFILWTDSSIVQRKLLKHPNKVDGSEATLILELQTKYNVRISKIPTELNPADVLSRGSLLSSLLKSDWFRGPRTLPCSVEDFPARLFSIMVDQYSTLIEFPTFQIMKEYFYAEAESLSKERIYKKLTIDEIAEICVLKIAQQQLLANEKMNAENRKYNIFEDEVGLFRISTRLPNDGMISYDFVYPIYLSNSCGITKALCKSIHETYHASATKMVELVRSKYWISHLHKLVKSIVNRCEQCAILYSKPYEAPMGPLANERTKFHEPVYSYVGMDHFGPLKVNLKDHGGKCYGLIFICLSTSNVHFELVSDLSANKTVEAIEIFMALHRVPKKFYSDNSQTFKKVKEVLQNCIRTKTVAGLELVPEYHFIPPYSPFRGGMWERNIKTCKNLFKNIVFGKNLSYNQLKVILYDIASIMNKKPMVKCNDIILSPSDIYKGQIELPSYIRPENNGKDEIVQRFFRRERVMQHIWNVLQSAYFGQNNQFLSGKAKDRIVPKVGQAVLLKSPNSDRIEWKRGVIKELIVGRDSVVRTVIVELEGNQLVRRSIQTICPLPEGSMSPDLISD